MIPMTIEQLREMFPGWLIYNSVGWLTVVELPLGEGRKMEIVGGRWGTKRGEACRCKKAYQDLTEG